ncbi:MAG: hypothetical protein ACKVOM_11765 [Ferruginibacter sp.]
MQKLSAYIEALAEKIEHAEKINPAVSSSSVGWHVQHSLMVITAISDQLKKSDSFEYKYRFNKWRTLVFLMNKIPRGKGKSPSFVNPLQVSSVVDLLAMVESSKMMIKELKTFPKHSYFTHPYFGKLHLNSSIQFLNIHTNHHLKIIKDIVQS